MKNKITIFSNGIADFIRNYEIEKGESKNISLAVKKDHVADVLASLNVFGKVKLASPPKFRPTFSDDKGLELNSQNVLSDMAAKLSGAQVSIKEHGVAEPSEGTLLGMQSDRDGSGKETISYLVFQAKEGIQTIPFADISDLVFADKAIQQEIKKALVRNLQKIKPTSTFVELELNGIEKSDVAIQYTVPAAAWKISYRLNDGPDGIDFKGLAIVDNNTEEDWEDVIISVVTGEPITFSTDLAESKIPGRNHINIVKDRAEGAVELLGFTDESRSVPSVSRSMKRSVVAACSLAPTAGLESMGGSAIQAETEIKESGDFAIFTAKEPVSINSNFSTIIPVFDSKLRDAKVVLHYKQSNHATRPYRSIQIKNDTGYSLGRGVCTVNLEGIYAGSCIVPVMKRDEEQLLPYALETGVKVNANQQCDNYKLCRIASEKGFLVTEHVQKINTSYTIKNVKNEEFEFTLDYSQVNPTSQSVAATISRSKSENLQLQPKVDGQTYRYDFKLNANQSLVINIVETNITTDRYDVDLNRFDWFYNGFISNDGPLSKVEKMADVLKIAEQIHETRSKIATIESTTERLEKKQERLRKNLDSISDKDVRMTYQNDLISIDKSLNGFAEDLPALEAAQEQLEKKFVKAMKAVSFELKM